MEGSLAESKPLFTRDSLLRLIVPLVIEQLLQMTVGMADTVMVTTAGEAAVSGVSLVDNINLLLIQVFAALSTGGAVVVAQYLGRRDEENAKLASEQLLGVTLLVSLVLMAVGLIFQQHILSLIFGQTEPAVMESALIYFLLTASAYPFIAIYNSGAAIFRAKGNSKVSMYCTLLVNLINISVNAILIYGFQMGAAGAGIGTLVSRIAAAAVVLFLLSRAEHGLHPKDFRHFRFHRSMIKSILLIGVPNGLENGMFQVGKLLVLNLITTFGTSAVAANAIANSIAGVVNVPGSALGLGLLTVVGQCMGASEPEQASRYTKSLLGVSYLCMGTLSLIQLFFAGFFVGLFHLTPEAMAMATELLQVCAIGNIFLWPVAFVLPNALRAAGDSIFTMAVSQCAMFLCRVGLSYLLACSWGLGLGLLGVWLAMIGDWVVRAAFFIPRYLRGSWKKRRVIQ